MLTLISPTTCPPSRRLVKITHSADEKYVGTHDNPLPIPSKMLFQNAPPQIITRTLGAPVASKRQIYRFSIITVIRLVCYVLRARCIVVVVAM